MELNLAKSAACCALNPQQSFNLMSGKGALTQNTTDSVSVYHMTAEAAQVFPATP